MAPNLAQYLNKTILVSIPALFEDAACRPCKLIAAELNGLWLQSEELNGRLLAHDKHNYAGGKPSGLCSICADCRSTGCN
jgi:hypothetical protein